MRRLRAFWPACTGLEGWLVLSGSGAAAAAMAFAGDAAGNQAALSAFAQQVQQGLSPTLTVDFGTPSASDPAGTVVMPAASYSPGLGYGWLSDPGKIKIRNGVATGRSGDFEIDVPPGTYDVTVTPAASPYIAAGSQVTAFAAGDTLGGPGAFFADPGPAHPVTVRTTVLQGGSGNGLTIALNGGFAVRSVQITTIAGSGAVGLFTSAQPAPAPGAGLVVSGSGGHLTIGGTAQATVLLPESGTITFDPQTGAPLSPSRNDPHNWGLIFTKAARSGIPNAPSDPPVGGVLSATSNKSIKNTGGLLDINTRQGHVELSVHGPANTALPIDDLLSPVGLTYKVHGGTGAFQGVEGRGTVDVELTPTGQSTEGTVTQGILTPSDAEGTLTFTFNPGM
jgi:hypothetical protein